MVLWRLCSSVTCSWVQPAYTPEHADSVPLISLPSWASSKVWASSSLSSLDTSRWISSRSDWEWNAADLIYCIYANNMSPQGWAMYGTCVAFSGRAASIHEHLCTAGPSVVSLCRPPVWRNASSCQLFSQPFTFWLPVIHSKGRRALYLCHMLLCACSDVEVKCYWALAICLRWTLRMRHLRDAVSCVDICLHKILAK